MKMVHSHRQQQPLEERESRPRAPVLRAEKRRILLDTSIQEIAKDPGLSRDFALLDKEMREIQVICKKSGCNCTGACRLDTCECLIAGILCCQSRKRGGRHLCSCASRRCRNVDPLKFGKRERVKSHYRETFRRLREEDKEEEDSWRPSVFRDVPHDFLDLERRRVEVDMDDTDDEDDD